jgi:hypothetical protein
MKTSYSTLKLHIHSKLLCLGIAYSQLIKHFYRETFNCVYSKIAKLWHSDARA